MSKLKISTKALYGLGFTSHGIKDGLFQVFLFFFYNQILGLDAIVTGTALTIALLFDAVSDPLVGVLSDDWKSKNWGRRHPFMFASAIPLGVFLYLLFIPPEGFTHTGLFWWLTTFAILVRLSLTLFIVPAMSLGAEMSTNYEERTSVTTYRITFSAFISPFIILFGLTTYFAPTEAITNGLFNKEAYPDFALLCGILAVLVIFISTYFTKSIIPGLPQNAPAAVKMTVVQVFKNLGKALSLKSYKSLISFVMFLHIALGVGIIFTPYYTTYYFGLSEKELGLMILTPAPGGILAFILGPKIGNYLDKKGGVILGTFLAGLFFTLPFNLRLLGLFPENGSSAVVLLYFLLTVIGYTFLWVSISLSHSMMAEVTDEYQLINNSRQEGLFFSSLSFAYKATVGLGSFIAGLLLNWISFPKQTQVEDVPAEAIYGIGLVGGPILLAIYLASLIFIVFYPISKSRYSEIRAGLQNK